MIIKAKLDSDIRRITISDTEFCQLPFLNFCEILSAAFQLTDEKITVKYKDEEGDLISITSDIEFGEAKKLVNIVDPSIFRVQLFANGERAPTDTLQEFVEVVLPFLKSEKFHRVVQKVIGTHKEDAHPYQENISTVSTLPEISQQIPPQVKEPEEKQLQKQENKQQIEEKVASSNAQNLVVQPVIVNTNPLPALVIEVPIVQQIIPEQPPIQIIPPTSLPIVQNPPIIQNMTSEIKKKPLLYCQFVTDVTIEDKTVIQPNIDFQKTWRLRNSSEVPLQNCYLTYIGGEKLNRESDSVLVPGSIAVSEEFDVSVNLRAPANPGKYIAYYQMTTQTGERFGHRVWVDIQVEGTDDDDSSPLLRKNDALRSDPLLPKKTTTKPLYGDPKYAPYATLLAQLADMGFNDSDANIAVLTSAQGNLEQAVQSLLDNMH